MMKISIYKKIEEFITIYSPTMENVLISDFKIDKKFFNDIKVKNIKKVIEYDLKISKEIIELVMTSQKAKHSLSYSDLIQFFLVQAKNNFPNFSNIEYDNVLKIVAENKEKIKYFYDNLERILLTEINNSLKMNFTLKHTFNDKSIFLEFDF